MRILVVEDEETMGALLRQSLEEHNHTVTLTRNGLDGFQAASSHRFDVILLDVMMPGMDGVSFARQLRAARQFTPILMLTARDSDADIVRGLDAGADDYLTKPFSLDVLHARLSSLTRRTIRTSENKLHMACVTLDADSRQVYVSGQPLKLTNTEFKLLELLMRRAGRAVSRTAIIESVWGFEDVEANTIDAFVSFLRKKLEAGGQPRLLQTVRGYGYILREEL